MTPPGVTYTSQRCVWQIQPRELPATCAVALAYTLIDLKTWNVGAVQGAVRTP